MRPLVLTGPTGAGKSAIALELAERWQAAVVSMDAMQVYRGMDVGTAKVSLEDQRRVPHRCIDVRTPEQAFSAADFVAEANAVPGRMVLAGGTTFYLRAFLEGLVAAPPVDSDERRRLESISDPHAALMQVDPVLATRLHPNDRVRIIRGLEFHARSGRRLSDAHAADPRTRRDAVICVVDRGDLYESLDTRVIHMMDRGYLEEVRTLLDQGYSRSLKSMGSLGYKHLAAHLDGELDLDEAIRLTQRDTRHLARKQRMFLRNFGLDSISDPAEAARLAFG